MTIPFFCTSESPIRQILKSTVWLRRPFLVFNFTSNTPSLHPKTSHSGKFIFLGSEWAFSHINKFEMLNSPLGNVFACIPIHFSELSSSIRFPETSLCSIYYCFCCWSFFFFSSQYFCPFISCNGELDFCLFDCSSDCCPSRSNHLMCVSGCHFVHLSITVLFTRTLVIWLSVRPPGSIPGSGRSAGEGIGYPL